MAKTPAKRRQAVAKMKVYKFDQMVMTTVDIPSGGTVERHVHKKDYVIIPFTAGKVRYIVYKGNEIVSRGTSTLAVGKPKYFAVGPDGRDVELLNLGGPIIFGKIVCNC
jgi:hypothetical protein